jgi:hypothetical protein
MAQQYSFPGPSGVTDQYAARKDLAGLVARDTTGAVRTGVFPRSITSIVGTRTDMQLNVGAFEAVAVQFGGPILIANDATVQVPIATAPASNSRIDVIYVKQNENASPATDPDNSLQLAAVTGVASASPVKPAIPAGALELATLLVPAGKTATNQSGVVLTLTHLWTAASGGVVLVRNQTELNAWAPMDGNDAYSIADNALYTRVSGAWVSAMPGSAPPIIVPLTPGTGWTPAAAPNAPRLVLFGNQVTLYGQLSWAGGGAYASIVTIPAAYRPPTLTALRNVGLGRQLTGTTLILFAAGLSTAGVVGSSSGATGSLPASGLVLLDGLGWVMD